MSSGSTTVYYKGKTYQMDNQPFDDIYSQQLMFANDFNAIRDYCADWRNGEPNWSNFYAGHGLLFAYSGTFDQCKSAVMKFIQDTTGEIPGDTWSQKLLNELQGAKNWVIAGGIIVVSLAAFGYAYSKVKN